MNSTNFLIRPSGINSSVTVLPTKSGSVVSKYHINCEHCHHHVRPNTSDKKRLLINCILCVLFMVCELVGGYLANSMAILTDAAHLLSDLAAFLISLLSIWLSSKLPTRKLNYGFYRAEVLGALFSVLVLWLLSGILIYAAVLRVIYMDFQIDGKIMVVAGAVGGIFNIIMIAVLKCKCGDDRPTSSLSMKAAILHVLGDLLQSVAIVVAALIIYFEPTYKLADPICTFLFSLFVLASTLKIMKNIVVILMEGIPKGVNLDEVMQIFLNVPDVVKIYNLRVWALSMDKTALSAHVAIRKGADAMVVLRQSTDVIKQKMNFFEITLQIEEFCNHPPDCSICQVEESAVAIHNTTSDEDESS